MSRVLLPLVLFGVLLTGVPALPPRASAAALLDGIGMMGDSLVDEYQFESNSYARNAFEQLSQYRGLNFGAFSESSRGEPRNAGYEYNWAEAAATSDDVLTGSIYFDPTTTPQDVGLAEQVAAGKVTLAYFGIGSNDFKYKALPIYTGQLAGAELDAFVDHVVENLRVALDRVRAAGDVKMVVGTIPNITRTPLARAFFTDADRRQLISDAVVAANTEIIDIARARQVPVIDLHGLIEDVFRDGHFTIGGVTIDGTSAGSDPHNGFCHDLIHPHTIPQGIAANLFIEAINRVYGAGIQPFSELELLQHAGIGDEYTGDVFFRDVDLARYVLYQPVPEPSTFMLALAGGSLAGIAVLARRHRRGTESCSAKPPSAPPAA